MSELRRHTEAIAVPRTPGSPGHARVRDYIVQELVGWKVRIQTIRIQGGLVFRNIVATLELETDLKSSVVLAAHYDSKRGLGPDYVAATDSATSCAILLQLARDLPRKGHLGRIRLVFFDGEEALEEPWTRSNALWGSRALAWHWSKTKEIQEIRLFLLLDLVGTSGTQFFSFWKETDPEFRALAALSVLFRGGSPPVASIDDDHLPFLRRGVPVLHLISVPFPRQWHTVHDTTAIVDYKILTSLCDTLGTYLRRRITSGVWKRYR